MSAYDPQLHDQQRELEALKARLARQERTTGVAVLVAMILAALTLALFVDELLEGEWPLGHLIDFIL
jgi:cobalamin biosynthesis protein CobD/CbiB